MASQFPTPESHHAYENRTLYGTTKTFNEGLLRSFHEMYGLNYVALRYFNVYGPRMDMHGVYTEVLIRWMERIVAENLYVGFILQAMATDFYPRLTAVGSDNTACNRIVNEQAQVSLLLAGPGVIATLTFAPLIIGLFYTPQFHAAVDVLRWLCLGMALRIISWPMGFIILSKGAQNFFFWSELAWTAVYLGLAWICVSSFG